MASVSAEAAVNVAAVPQKYSLRKVEIAWGTLFITPWIIGFLLFTAFPMIASLYLSFTNYNITSSRTPSWVGMSNYSRMLSLEVKTLDDENQSSAGVLSGGYSEWFRIGKTVIGATDPFFWKSMKVTLFFGFVALPVGLLVALGIAALVNMPIIAVKLFRSIFYLPSVVPAVAGALVMQQMYNRDVGWINSALQVVGIEGPNWLSDERFVMPALVMIGLWGIGNAMIIYLAGLQGVPTELYEAAKVDGANAFLRFYRITLPMITPVILYNLITGLIGTFQYFTTAFVLTGGRGDPNYATYFYNLYLYKVAFVFQDTGMGYASAMAWILLIIVVIITAIVFLTSGKWVFYAGERK
jgi:multiple sugar transport system permease protein